MPLKKRIGLIFLAAIIAITLSFAIPFSPWIKPEITENGKIVTIKDGRCAVETESSNIIHIDNCEHRSVGERVTVKYRETTTIGELVP